MRQREEHTKKEENQNKRITEERKKERGRYYNSHEH
jgi:hypothetical protein